MCGEGLVLSGKGEALPSTARLCGEGCVLSGNVKVLAGKGKARQ